MRRGEVWLASFDPSVGSESAKTRPCVIVSSDASNKTVERLARGVVTVVPLTTNVSSVYEFQTIVAANTLNGLPHDSKAQAEQVRALDWARFMKRLGVLDAPTAAAVDAALLIHLSLA